MTLDSMSALLLNKKHEYANTGSLNELTRHVLFEEAKRLRLCC